MGFPPVCPNAHVDIQGHLQLCDRAHSICDELPEPLGVFRAHLEKQLVVDLEDHPGPGRPLLLQR